MYAKGPAKGLPHVQLFRSLVVIVTMCMFYAWYDVFFSASSGDASMFQHQASRARGSPTDPLMDLVIPQRTARQGAMQVSLDYHNAYEQVYSRQKYSACPSPTISNNSQCWLLLTKPVDCDTLFTEYVKLLEDHVPMHPPPKELPVGQVDEFLLGGFTHFSQEYYKQSDYAPNAEMPVWTAATISDFVEKAKARQGVGLYNNGALAVYNALDCHPIKGAFGAVFGTQRPWLEAVLFAFGAKKILTVEFRKTLTKIPNHEIVTPLEWAQRWQHGELPPVDYAVSFSSWEHDGLGRYGDPIDPWGDIKSMQRASCFVKPGGLLFFGAPMSAVDQLQYNAHRIYGFTRLPLMTADWEVLGSMSHANRNVVEWTHAQEYTADGSRLLPRHMALSASGCVAQFKDDPM